MASAASATDAEPATQRVLTRLGRFFGAEVSSSPGSITPRTTATSAQASATRSTSLQAAEANVARAWEALREIQAEQERLLALPEVVALTRAEQALAQAETRLAQATADVKRLRQPDRVPLEAAERTLWRAEATLRAAHSLRPVNEWSLSPVDRAEEIKQAELAVQDARAKRDAALVGPPVEALAAAEVELTQAQAAQADAAERVQKLRLFVTTIPLEQVKAATASAITDLANAEAQLRSLQLQEARHTQATYGR